MRGKRTPWAGTPFEAEYKMLADAIERERANVNALADALMAFWETTTLHKDCDCGGCIRVADAEAALRAAGRLP